MIEIYYVNGVETPQEQITVRHIFTNADRIRTMTDEKLAEWMNDGWLDVAISKSMVSTEQWLDWLRKETE